MSRLLQSFRYTTRQLLKSPGFAITAIVVLGFGIGTNTAIFSLIDAVLLNPLPFPQSNQLIRVSQPPANSNYWDSLDYPAYLDIRSQSHSFDVLVGSTWWFLDLSGRGGATRLTAIFATPELFKVTNLPFVLGRPFTAEEDKPGGPLVTVLSEDLWRTRFNSDPNVIGKNVILSGQTFEVIGVCPRQVEDISTPPSDLLYVPLHVNEFLWGPWLQNRNEHVVICFGRLREGISLRQAQAELEVIRSNLVKQYPESEQGYGLRVDPLVDHTVASYAGTVWLLGAAVGCVLLTSCANVANLLFARALARRREMAIRASLGASRLDLVGQLLLETGLLSMLSSVVGLVIAVVTIELVKAFSSQDLYRFQQVGLNANALLFVFCVTTIVSFLSGFLPAWSLSGVNLASALREEGGRAGTDGPQRQKTQSVLVAGEVALACVLLVGTGLLTRSFLATLNQPLGFNPDHVLTCEVNPTSQKYTQMPPIRELFEGVLERVRRLPGVISAASNQEQPFEWTFGDPNSPLWIPGQPDPQPGDEPMLCAQAISPGYFETLQIPIVDGRDFDQRDRSDSEQVVIVDQALAQHFFAGQSPLGRQIQTIESGESNRRKTWTIIGVAQNSLHNTADRKTAPFQAYFPYSQSEDLFRQFILLRTSGDPAALIPAVRKIVASVDPDVPVTQPRAYNDLIALRSWGRRFGVLLASIFSGVALLLAALGLYGVLAYSVNQRKREIGVRMAMGARVGNILRLVVVKGLTLVCIGLLVGISTALIGTRFLESVLYGVSANDPVSLGLATLILGATGLCACLLPALHATRIDPITAMRE